MTQPPQNHPPVPLPPSPWESIITLGTRLFAWGSLFGVLYVLRSFFLLIFLTFVFAYIQASGIERFGNTIKSRPIRVVIVAATLLLTMIVAGIYLVPKVSMQTEIFFSQYGAYMTRVDQELYDFSEKYPLIKEAIPQLTAENAGFQPNNKMDLKNSPTVTIIEKLLDMGGEEDGAKNMAQVIDAVKGLSGHIASIGSAFVLSLLFSFLIVLDLPRLSKSVADLEYTKVRFIYVEVADSIREFANVLGRALQAQLFIAILNSLLTAIGLYLLGLGAHVAFLSVIVFICSFIPVAGVFISSVPISLIALQTAGLKIMFLTIALITLIHLVEGYVLNPKIYGTFMRINPVIVLIILTVGGKLFQLWGLILGVPVCTYIFGHAIQIKNRLSIETRSIPEADA
jgi:predicted PurR-regulated permease PerM